MGKLNKFFISLLVMVFVTTNYMVGASLSGVGKSSKVGLMGYIQKINPFGVKPGNEFTGSSSSSSFSSTNGHLSGVNSQQTNVNGHVQGSTIFYDNGKTSSFHGGHYAGSITCPNCHCHFPLSAGPSCMAQPFGGSYSQKLNTGSSASSNMQGSNMQGNTVNNVMSSSNTQAAQSQLHSHSNGMSNSNIQNSNYAQSYGSQFTNLMAKTGSSASAESFATSNSHGIQSESAAHSKSFSGLNSHNAYHAHNDASQFNNVMANAHANAANVATGSFASSNVHGAQSQLTSHANSFSESALNQGHMSTGSQFTNVMSNAAQVNGGLALNSNSMSSSSSSSSSSQSSVSSSANVATSTANVVDAHAHSDHHRKCPSCGGSNYNGNQNLAHAHSGSFAGSTASSSANSFSGNQIQGGVATAAVAATAGSITTNKGDQYVRSLSAATAKI